MGHPYRDGTISLPGDKIIYDPPDGMDRDLRAKSRTSGAFGTKHRFTVGMTGEVVGIDALDRSIVEMGTIPNEEFRFGLSLEYFRCLNPAIPPSPAPAPTKSSSTFQIGDEVEMNLVSSVAMGFATNGNQYPLTDGQRGVIHDIDAMGRYAIKLHDTTTATDFIMMIDPSHGLLRRAAPKSFSVSLPRKTDGACICSVTMLMSVGCKCGAIDPYQPPKWGA